MLNTILSMIFATLPVCAICDMKVRSTHTYTHISLLLLVMVIMCNILLLVSLDLLGTATLRLCQKLPAVGSCMADQALKTASKFLMGATSLLFDYQLIPNKVVPHACSYYIMVL